MGTSTSLQLSLVLFIGLAAAMLLPSVRRSVPRWIEAFIWLGLIASGWLTVATVQRPSARFLTDSVTWGAGQVVNVSVEILIANVKGWLADHRFEIANTVVLLALIDVFLLAALQLRRQAKKSLPRVMLGEWFEFTPAKPVRASTWFGRGRRWGRNGVAIQLKARQARSVAGGRPVDLRALAGVESVGPIRQSSLPALSLDENETEDRPTRLAS